MYGGSTWSRLSYLSIIVNSDRSSFRCDEPQLSNHQPLLFHSSRPRSHSVLQVQYHCRVRQLTQLNPTHAPQCNSCNSLISLSTHCNQHKITRLDTTHTTCWRVLTCVDISCCNPKYVQGQFALATQHCDGDPQALDLILTRQAERLYEEGKYVESAMHFAKTRCSFEEVTLRFTAT